MDLISVRKPFRQRPQLQIPTFRVSALSLDSGKKGSHHHCHQYFMKQAPQIVFMNGLKVTNHNWEKCLHLCQSQDINCIFLTKGQFKTTFFPLLETYNSQWITENVYESK